MKMTSRLIYLQESHHRKKKPLWVPQTTRKEERMVQQRAPTSSTATCVASPATTSKWVEHLQIATWIVNSCKGKKLCWSDEYCCVVSLNSPLCDFVELQESHEQCFTPAEDDGDSAHEQRLSCHLAAKSAGVSTRSKQRRVSVVF